MPAKLLLMPTHGYGARVVEASGTGPDADATVGAGATATVSVTVSDRDISPGSTVFVAGVSGLPAGVAIAGVEVSAGQGSATVTLTLYNPSGADVTVPANSVTVKIVAIG